MPITGEGQCLLAHTSERPCYQADYSKLYSTILMIKLIITCNIIYISVGQWLVCEWIHLNNLLLVKMPRHVILMIDTVWSSTDEWQGPGPPNSRESATPRIPTGIPKNYWILRGNLRKFQKVTNLVNFCSGFWNVEILPNFDLMFPSILKGAIDGQTKFLRVFDFVILSYSWNSQKFDAQEMFLSIWWMLFTVW